MALQAGEPVAPDRPTASGPGVSGVYGKRFDRVAPKLNTFTTAPPPSEVLNRRATATP